MWLTTAYLSTLLTQAPASRIASQLLGTQTSKRIASSAITNTIQSFDQVHRLCTRTDKRTYSRRSEACHLQQYDMQHEHHQPLTTDFLSTLHSRSSS
ncbi:hypothetical protein V8C26DRAFT_410328 [Trichoderma gracile]